VDYDINHILETGQSNSVGLEASPPITLTQPFTNMMFNTGVMTATDCDGDGCVTQQTPTSFVPLVEGGFYIDKTHETSCSGLGNLASRLGVQQYLPSQYTKHDILVSLHGRSGYTYACLRKNGCDFFGTPNPYTVPFDDGMIQVQTGMSLAQAAGKSYVVRAVTSIHGESDHYAYTTGAAEFPMPSTDGQTMLQDYSDALIEWQKDYEESVKTITNQTEHVPLIILQMSNWNDVPHSQIPTWQLSAHVRAPGKVVLATSGYFFSYAEDCLHFDAVSERRIGEYFAKVYARIVFQGLSWEPVRPKSVTLSGNVITAQFYVPVPPLVLDTDRVSNPGNFGFEYTDDSSAPPSITNVAIDGPDTVKITLDSAPTGTGPRLRYAFTAVPLTCPGPEDGPRGNLRDSDNTPSNYNNELFNWGVTFDEPVN